MITQTTAQRIDNVCDNIRNCRLSLDLIYKETPLDIYVNVMRKGKDEVISLQLTDEIAESALGKLFGALKAEYAALNKRGIEEANNE